MIPLERLIREHPERPAQKRASPEGSRNRRRALHAVDVGWSGKKRSRKKVFLEET
jgi:hypothetical protein